MTFGDNKAVGPTVYFSDEDLPEWIRKAIAMLNLVDKQDSIPGVGHRVGKAYWIFTGFTGANSPRVLYDPNLVPPSF